MGANDAQHFRRSPLARQREIALDDFVAVTLAGDLCNRLQAGELVPLGRCAGRGDHRHPGFVAAMTIVDGDGRARALARCRRNRGLRIKQQSMPVVLDRNRIIAALLDNRGRHRTVTMQCIGGDHTTLQGQQSNELQGNGCFVVALRQHVGQSHAGLRTPGRNHDRRHVAFAAVVGAPERLAVERDDALHVLRKGLHELTEGAVESLRIEQAKDAAEGIRHSMGQNQHRPQQCRLGFGEQCHVAARLGAAQCGQKRDEQNLRQIVQRIARPRVGKLGKTLRKSLHRYRPPIRGHLQNPILLSSQHPTRLHMRFPCPQGRGSRIGLPGDVALFHLIGDVRAGVRWPASRVIFSRDILAGVVGHESRRYQADHRAAGDVNGDRVAGMIGREQGGRDDRRRPAGNDRR